MHVSITVRQLAEMVQGLVHGDGELLIGAARPISEAQPGDITFLENDKHSHLIPNCQASAVVVPAASAVNGKTLIRVNDPLGAFITIVRHLHGLPEPTFQGIDPRACIHPSARIGAEASIYPFACIGEKTVLGSRCRIHNGCSIGRFCKLGDDVVLYPNVVIYEIGRAHV